MKKQLYLFGGTRPTFPNLCNVNKHINQKWKMATKHPKGKVTPISWVTEEITALPCQTRWWMLASICHHWHPETLEKQPWCSCTCNQVSEHLASQKFTFSSGSSIMHSVSKMLLTLAAQNSNVIQQTYIVTKALAALMILLLAIRLHHSFFAGCSMLEKSAGASPWGI